MKEIWIVIAIMACSIFILIYWNFEQQHQIQSFKEEIESINQLKEKIEWEHQKPIIIQMDTIQIIHKK